MLKFQPIPSPSIYLAIEDVVGCVFLEFEVPYEGHSVRVVGDVGVRIVGDQ